MDDLHQRVAESLEMGQRMERQQQELIRQSGLTAIAAHKLLEDFSNPWPEGTYANAQWELSRAARSLFFLVCHKLRVDRLAARLTRLFSRAG